MNLLQRFLIVAIMAFLVSACQSTDTREQDSQASETEDASSESATSVAVDEGSASDSEGSSEEEDQAADIPSVVYFDFDQSQLKPETRSVLLRHAAYLRSNDDLSIRLEGHTDERGTREYNIALGERRANSVRDFLVLQGIDGSRIETVSYGEERPAVMGSNEAAWSKNRRVEIKY